MKDLFTQEYKDWFESYSLATKPEERVEAMKRGLAEDPSPENQWRMELIKARYCDKKGEISKADYFLAAWMDLESVPRMNKQFFGKKQARKAFDSAVDKLLLTADKSDWPQWKVDILQNEYEHLVKYYLTLCQNDKMYTGLIMGFMTMKDEKIKSKLIDDLNTVVVDTPAKMDAVGIMAPLKRAVENIIK